MSYFQAKLPNKFEELQQLKLKKWTLKNHNESRNLDLFTSSMHYVFI